ncbi:hypothetical protein EO244_00485 [Ancylomarina salipaludis]|uniref:Thiopeptide-type bacteriocin biosynthesis domain-containing protein n=1 Tax=Ancylomarina salipaludis TaxID=2501299 RepID=A0A4Q1JPS7_9BACT|nr:thiopeptide-type bacteriocin biosynthesis protein [Ancylomarina salipaludis]RXQ97399.1 hypothetical protein EO244_00485 [Ancylomarina salipaludis]
MAKVLPMNVFSSTKTIRIEMTLKLEKRRFFLGDEWLYYKLYGGPKLLEDILVNDIYSVLDDLKSKGEIENYFFLRFADPEYHLRLRLFIPQKENLGKIILVVNQLLSTYVSNRLIHKVENETYVREIERYGKNTIGFSEELFGYDSDLILKYLNKQEGEKQDKWRWLFGVRLVDNLLNNFNLTIAEKKSLFDRLSHAYLQEFSGGKVLKLQLDRKFRKYRPMLNSILGPDEYSDENDVLIRDFLNVTKNLCEKIIRTVNLEGSDSMLVSLLNSYIHMHYNRLIRTKQRASELVIYYMLSKYYESYMAQMKYRKRN